MRRGKSRNPNENPGVAPVTQLELSQKSPKKRIIIAAVLLVIGVSFLTYGVINTFFQKEGWVEVETLSTTGGSVASDLTFLYDLGASGNSAGAEYKELTQLYTELCDRAYRLFDADADFDDINNIYYLNRHPNKTVEVDPALYRAFALLERMESRLLFAAPYYTAYQNMFTADDDVFAAEVDPNKNSEITEYFASLSVYTSSAEHVRLELLDENQVKLTVSEEYLGFAAEEGIDCYIDFYWARNAFAVDYIADALIERGFTYGSISSYDGFLRGLDRRETDYSYNLYTRYDGRIYGAARLDYKGSNSIVFLHAYQMSDEDQNYYAYQNGELRFPYIDPLDGYCRNAMGEMVSYSRTAGCAEVLLSMLPLYMTDIPDYEAISDLTQDGIHSVYFDGVEIHYNDPSVTFENIYQYGTVSFRTVRDQ